MIGRHLQHREIVLGCAVEMRDVEEAGSGVYGSICSIAELVGLADEAVVGEGEIAEVDRGAVAEGHRIDAEERGGAEDDYRVGAADAYDTAGAVDQAQERRIRVGVMVNM